jgi:hypothetical protein
MMMITTKVEEYHELEKNILLINEYLKTLEASKPNELRAAACPLPRGVDQHTNYLSYRL